MGMARWSTPWGVAGFLVDGCWVDGSSAAGPRRLLTDEPVPTNALTLHLILPQHNNIIGTEPEYVESHGQRDIRRRRAVRREAQPLDGGITRQRVGFDPDASIRAEA